MVLIIIIALRIWELIRLREGSFPILSTCCLFCAEAIRGQIVDIIIDLW